MSFLIAGLGNIGADYVGTRHNIGFMVLDAWAKASNTSFSVLRYASMAQVKCLSNICWLIKPSTYMNRSGKAVRYWLEEERIPIENLMVVVDDTALPFGTLRMRKQGSDGGHHGLGDINLSLNTTEYARIRVGVGNDFPKGCQADYVLDRFTAEQAAELPLICNRVVDAIRNFVLFGIDRAMNLCNTKAACD